MPDLETRLDKALAEGDAIDRKHSRAKPWGTHAAAPAPVAPQPSRAKLSPEEGAERRAEGLAKGRETQRAKAKGRAKRARGKFAQEISDLATAIANGDDPWPAPSRLIQLCSLLLRSHEEIGRLAGRLRALEARAEAPR